jgi:hypothetical protein
VPFPYPAQEEYLAEHVYYRVETGVLSRFRPPLEILEVRAAVPALVLVVGHGCEFPPEIERHPGDLYDPVYEAGEKCAGNPVKNTQDQVTVHVFLLRKMMFILANIARRWILSGFLFTNM